MSENVKKEKKAESRFSKEQLISSERYVKRRDLIDALLEDDRKYTIKEVDKKINEFMKGKVKR